MIPNWAGDIKLQSDSPEGPNALAVYVRDPVPHLQSRIGHRLRQHFGTLFVCNSKISSRDSADPSITVYGHDHEV